MSNAITVDPKDIPAVMSRIGTSLVGVLFVVSGIAKVLRFSAVAGALGGKGLPFPEAVLALVVLVEIVCGGALIVLPAPRKPAAVLAVFVVAATILFHAFWQSDAAAFQNQLNHFLKNVAIFGALLTIAFAARRQNG
jgi:putative oxidoreductase